MPSVSLPTAAIIAGGVGAAGGVASGLIGAGAAKSAASTQAGAARYAADLQNSQFQQTLGNLQPYINTGTSMLPALSAFPGLASTEAEAALARAQGAVPQNVSSATIQNMPGFQFNLEQGQKAVQNAAASRGQGISGTALKSAGNFATGLSNNYYQNYFQNQNQIYQDQSMQFQNTLRSLGMTYDQLYGIAGLGENAAAGAGNIGQKTAQSEGAAIQAAGQAQAAGISGAANAITSGLNTATNALGSSPLNYLLYKQLLGGSTPVTPAMQGVVDQYGPTGAANTAFGSTATNLFGLE